MLHMDQLTRDSSRVEFSTGIAGPEPCWGQEGSALGFGRTHGMANNSCEVWTQIQMLIPKLLPKACQVFGSGVLAWSCPELSCLFGAFFFTAVSLELGMQTVARALGRGSGWMGMESGYSSAGWVWPQPTLCRVVPPGGIGQTLRLPRHFLPLRSNVVTLSSRNVMGPMGADTWQ